MSLERLVQLVQLDHKVALELQVPPVLKGLQEFKAHKDRPG